MTHDIVIKDTPILTAVFLLVVAAALAIVASIFVLTSIKKIEHNH
jgi:hypothetical protein